MSSGQRPRRPVFFPKMKYRAKARRRAWVTFYDSSWRPYQCSRPDLDELVPTEEYVVVDDVVRWSGRRGLT